MSLLLLMLHRETYLYRKTKQKKTFIIVKHIGFCWNNNDNKNVTKFKLSTRGYSCSARTEITNAETQYPFIPPTHSSSLYPQRRVKDHRERHMKAMLLCWRTYNKKSSLLINKSGGQWENSNFQYHFCILFLFMLVHHPLLAIGMQLKSFTLFCWHKNEHI